MQRTSRCRLRFIMCRDRAKEAPQKEGIYLSDEQRNSNRETHAHFETEGRNFVLISVIFLFMRSSIGNEKITRVSCTYLKSSEKITLNKNWDERKGREQMRRRGKCDWSIGSLSNGALKSRYRLFRPQAAPNKGPSCTRPRQSISRLAGPPLPAKPRGRTSRQVGSQEWVRAPPRPRRRCWPATPRPPTRRSRSPCFRLPQRLSWRRNRRLPAGWARSRG